MDAGKKVDNSAENVAGKAKEATGKATGNDELRAEGKRDQKAAKLKKAAQDVKDAFKG